MSDRGQRTEQATPRRLQKAREQGQFPLAKEFVGAIQFAVITGMISAWAASWFGAAQNSLRDGLHLAFRPDFNVAAAVDVARKLVISGYLPFAGAAAILMGITLLTQLVSTNMGFSASKLAPSLARFNPMARIKDIPRQSVPQAIQAILLAGVLAVAVHALVREHLDSFLRLPTASLQTGIHHIAGAMMQLLWRLAAILVLFGVVEFLRQRWIYHGDLSMTKQEVREEHKEQEGDPQIKGRIRRLRRELLRRRMMQHVPTATAVIVNPTHFAVAIRYEPETMASPVLVAKGRNFLAAKIRQIATENGITIVENPPLARALYQSVEVGREIPPDFYRAVAEVLAYVYRLTGMRDGHRN
jgi:flagellar biosynthetic protein FlhB